MTPILACRGIELGPGPTALLTGAGVLWLVGLLLVIPNLCLIFRNPEKAVATMSHLIFFIIYLSAALLLFSGTPFQWDLVYATIVIFALPIMVIGHFVWLFKAWRREKKVPVIATKPVEKI